MNTYKITNITDTAAKRDRKHNTTLAIQYVDKMTKKTLSVKPGATIYLTTASLPLSVHRLRIKNLITVTEVAAPEIKKPVAKPKKKAPAKSKKLVATITEEKAVTPKKGGRPKKTEVKTED